MMWTDVYDKWVTGKFEDITCEFPGLPSATLSREKCEAGMGDLMKEYVRVLNAPWWRRAFGWRYAEEFLRHRLNVFSIDWFK